MVFQRVSGGAGAPDPSLPGYVYPGHLLIAMEEVVDA